MQSHENRDLQSFLPTNLSINPEYRLTIVDFGLKFKQVNEFQSIEILDSSIDIHHYKQN